MTFDDPMAITGLSLSALEYRRAQAALLTHHDNGLSAMPGALHGLGCSVSGLTLTVAAGSAVLTPSTGANGSYLAVLASAETATITAQDATYARIDRVALRIYDTEVDGSGYSKAAVEIIAGTPAASPVAPTLPTGRLEIAQLQVPKSGAGSITVVDKRLWTATLGAPIMAASYATLPSGTMSFLRVGQRAITLDGPVTWRWTGTEWRVDGMPIFATTTARDTAIPSPGIGDRCFVTADNSEYRCLTAGSWKLWSRPTTSWTPSISNVTAGIALESATYNVTDGVIRCDLSLACTAAVTASNLDIGSMPVGMSMPATYTQIGTCILNPDGTRRQGLLVNIGTGAVRLFAIAPSTGALQSIGASSPATWSARSTAVTASWSAPVA